MRRAIDVGEQHISLATASAHAYRDIMGEPLAAAPTVAAWNATLHAVAKALSKACPVYAAADDGKLSRLSMMALVEGEFDHGGAMLRAAGGTVYRQLTVSWRDLEIAMATLKNIGVTFEARPR